MLNKGSVVHYRSREPEKTVRRLEPGKKKAKASSSELLEHDEDARVVPAQLQASGEQTGGRHTTTPPFRFGAPSVRILVRRR